MDSTPATYNFKPQYGNSYFTGRKLTITKTIEGVTTPFDLTGATITIMFKVVKTGIAAQTLTIGNGITVNDAVNGIFSIDGGNITLPPKDYFYDIKITDSSDRNLYWIKGTRRIEQNTTDNGL